MSELESARAIASDSAGVDGGEKSSEVPAVERPRVDAPGDRGSGGRAGRSSGRGGRGGRGRGRGRPKKAAEGTDDVNASLFWLVQVRLSVRAGGEGRGSGIFARERVFGGLTR